MNNSSISPGSIPELIEALGGPSEFGRIIGKRASTAGEMKRTGSVRVEYWPQIVVAAEARGIPGITLEAIALMHAKKTGHNTEPAEAAE